MVFSFAMHHYYTTLTRTGGSPEKRLWGIGRVVW